MPSEAADPHVRASLLGLQAFLAVASSKAWECHHAQQPLSDAVCKGSGACETEVAIDSLKRHARRFRYASQSQLRKMLKQQGLAALSERVLYFAWKRSRLFAAQHGQDESQT